MQENEFVLLSASDLETLKLEIEAVRSFHLISDSKSTQRIVDNQDGHIKYSSEFCFVLPKHFTKYSTTIEQIHTCAQDFMEGYYKGVQDGIKKGIGKYKQFLKDEKEAYKENKLGIKHPEILLNHADTK